jgi:hypothetical protein
MSHVVTVSVEIRDLEAVKRLCDNLGWQFQENKTSYKWYGRWVGDYNEADAAINNGIKPEDLGKCDHAIAVPGCGYELGLKKIGEEYKLLWDFYDPTLKQAMGGASGEKFCQEYGLACVTLEAERNGYGWTKTVLDNGSYEIQIETY